MLCFVGSYVEELQECTVFVSFKMSSIEFGINIHSRFGFTVGMVALIIYNHSY